jgi:glutathione synthase/RimK-type ligase-like ATP-grasp enzyme
MARVAFLTLVDRTGYVIDDDQAIEELSRRGVAVDEVPWEAPSVDWGRYDGVIIRTTWDYQRHLDRFLAVLDGIERQGVPLANPLALVRWNARKTYLADLAARGVPIVPTRFGHGLTSAELAALPGALGVAECVLKPVVGANADDTYRVGAGLTPAQATAICTRFAGRDWMVQPFQDSVLTEGEHSLFYFDGRFSHAVVKRPKPGDFRVQEEHGGRIARAVASPELRAAVRGGAAGARRPSAAGARRSGGHRRTAGRDGA